MKRIGAKSKRQGKKKSTRRSVVKTLNESTEHYSSLFQVSPDAHYVTDLKGNLVDCNKAAEQLLGWKRDEMISKNFRDFRINTDAEMPRVQKLFSDLVAGRAVQSTPHTFTVLRKNGSQISVEVFCQIVKIKNRKLLYTVVRDITTRMLSEQQLKESELRYQALVSHLPDAVYIYDDGKYVYSNEAGVKLLGLGDAGQLLGQDIMRFVHPDYKDVIRQRRENIEQKRSAAPLFEQKLVRHDGLVIDIDVRSIPFPYNNKSMILAIVRDISARKRFETSLRRSEEALRTFIEQSVEGIIIVGENGRVIEWNSAMTAISGLPREQTIGWFFWEVHQLLLPENKRDAAQLEQARTMIQGFLRTGEVESKLMIGEVQTKSADGTAHCIQLKIFPISTPIGYRLGVVAQDITSQKEMERRILEVSDQIQRQIGHDIHDGVNQLLMVLKLRLSVLQEDLASKSSPAAEEAGRLSSMIKQAMDQMISLTQGLSPVSIEHGGLAVALGELVKSTKRIFDIQCTGDIDRDIVLTDLATATHLYRIAQEAMNNTVKHASAGSINVVLKGKYNGIYLEVSDNGRGFNPGEINGNGMGLTIMRYRANLIGALLQVSKNTQGGTTVSCMYGPESH